MEMLFETVFCNPFLLFDILKFDILTCDMLAYYCGQISFLGHK